MDLQGLIQSLLVASILRLSLKQKPCAKDSKFYQTLEVQSLQMACFFTFITFWSTWCQGFKRAILLIWQTGNNQSFCVIEWGFKEIWWWRKSSLLWPVSVPWPYMQGAEVVRHVVKAIGWYAGFHNILISSHKYFEDLVCEVLVLQSW